MTKHIQMLKSVDSQALFSNPCNKIVELTLDAPEKVVIHQGGTSSGKTYGIMQALLAIAINEPNRIMLCVGATHKQIERGCLRDLQNILKADPHLNQYVKQFNKNKMTYYFRNGTIMEFASFEDGYDAHAGKRDYSFFNEANNIPFAVFKEINNRTSIKTIIDFNPSSEFWAHTQVWKPTKMQGGEPLLDEEGKEIHEFEYQYERDGTPKYFDYPVRDSFGNKVKNEDGTIKTERKPLRYSRMFKTTYRHNMYVSDQIVADIEKYKEKDPEYYKVYGLGELGKIEGLVFKKLERCDKIPEGLENIYGMDFGWSDDPNVIVRVAIDKPNNHLYIQEVLYAKSLAMGFDKMAEKIHKNIGFQTIWCDHNPLMIMEFQQRNCMLMKAKKGSGSILSGIRKIQNFDQIFVTWDSPNVWKDFINYKYGKDKNDNNEQMPAKGHDHAPDAVRYAVIMSDYVQTNTAITISLGVNHTPDFSAFL